MLDRVETLRLAGYSEDEKREIARRYLIPRQVGEVGLQAEQLSIVDLPKENESDLAELPEHVRNDIEFLFAERIEDLLAAAIPDLAERLCAGSLAPNWESGEKYLPRGCHCWLAQQCRLTVGWSA